jgi:hypothetical protein
LRTYLENRSEPAPEIRRFAQEIEDSTRDWAEQLWRQCAKRCRSTNKEFRVFTGPLGWCVARRDLDSAEVESLLTTPDEPFSRPGTILLKDSRTTTVAETTMTVGGRPSRVIYKRSNRKKWIDLLLNLVRPSRAGRSWQAGQHLASRGIPTPRNLALLARKRSFPASPFAWFLPHETYLIMIKQENAATLSEYIRQELPALDPPKAKAQTRRVTLGLARLVRSLHERSLSQRDLGASDILVRLDALQSDEFLSLIDLVGGRLLNPVPRRRKIQNLARLSISLDTVPGRTRTETLRFLHAYLPWGCPRSVTGRTCGGDRERNWGKTGTESTPRTSPLLIVGFRSRRPRFSDSDCNRAPGVTDISTDTT